MKKLLCIAAFVITGCDSHILTYEELRKYPVSCAKEQKQLAELREIQAIKNFADDPDQLNEQDRAYNSRLKATIWWYGAECHREKITASIPYADQ